MAPGPYPRNRFPQSLPLGSMALPFKLPWGGVSLGAGFMVSKDPHTIPSSFSPVSQDASSQLLLQLHACLPAAMLAAVMVFFRQQLAVDRTWQPCIPDGKTHSDAVSISRSKQALVTAGSLLRHLCTVTLSLSSRSGQKERANWAALGASNELVRSVMDRVGGGGICCMTCLECSGISGVQTAVTLLELPGSLAGASTSKGKGTAGDQWPQLTPCSWLL